MDPETQQTNLTINRHSFLVRIWREGSGSQWQGWVQHIRTGEAVTFRSLNELLDFVQRWEKSQTQEGGRGLK